MCTCNNDNVLLRTAPLVSCFLCNKTAINSFESIGAVMMTRMMILPMEPSPPFVADHPFMYYIRDVVNKSVLFVGHLAKPPSH